MSTPWCSRDQRDDVAHHLVEVPVLGGVDGGHAGLAQRGGVGVGNDPADHDRDVSDARLGQRLEHRRDQLGVRAGQDREADHVHALLGGRAGDLGRGQPDALVDDVHAGVAGPDGDLLGAVGVPVEARLADQELQPAAERLAEPLDLVAQLGHVLAGDRGRLADAGGRAVLAEHARAASGTTRRWWRRRGRRRSWPA